MSDITTTTTATTVQPSAPEPQKVYDNWGVTQLIFAGIAGVIIIAAAAIGMVDIILKWTKGRHTQELELIAPLAKKIDEVKVDLTKFRPSDAIDREFHRLEGEIEHNKNNGRTAHDQLHSMYSTIRSEVSAMQVEQTRITTQVQGMGGDIKRVESSVERMSERMDERFDRIQDLIVKQK